MHRIHYSGESFLVRDDVSRALLEYARALAEAVRADTVLIPVLVEGSEPVEAEILIGPASQLMATPAGPDPADEVAPAVVAELGRRSSRLRPPRPAAETEAPWHDYPASTSDI
jgi:hypothetical protein